MIEIIKDMESVLAQRQRNRYPWNEIAVGEGFQTACSNAQQARKMNEKIRTKAIQPHYNTRETLRLSRSIKGTT